MDSNEKLKKGVRGKWDGVSVREKLVCSASFPRIKLLFLIFSSLYSPQRNLNPLDLMICLPFPVYRVSSSTPYPPPTSNFPPNPPGYLTDENVHPDSEGGRQRTAPLIFRGNQSTRTMYDYDYQRFPRCNGIRKGESRAERVTLEKVSR